MNHNRQTCPACRVGYRAVLWMGRVWHVWDAAPISRTT